MLENNINKRVDYALELLLDFKGIFLEISKCTSSIESGSSEFFHKLYLESKIEVQQDIEKYRTNIAQIKQLNADMTSKINDWYGFVKSPEELKKLIFPFKYYVKKRKLGKYIKKTNENISDLTIENRFIAERLADWEHQLELKAIKLIKQDEDFKRFEQLLDRKNTVVSELNYLLPTIPGLCPLELDMNSIDIIIEKLQKTPAA